MLILDWIFLWVHGGGGVGCHRGGWVEVGVAVNMIFQFHLTWKLFFFYFLIKNKIGRAHV